MRKKWHSFIRLTRFERRLVIRALLLLPACVLALRVYKFARLRSILSRCRKSGTTAGISVPASQTTTYTRCVTIAERNLPFRITCLPRSLVLWRLLMQDGVECEVRFGICKESGTVTAHAWVEGAGRVINDCDNVSEKFTTFEQAVL